MTDEKVPNVSPEAINARVEFYVTCDWCHEYVDTDSTQYAIACALRLDAVAKRT